MSTDAIAYAAAQIKAKASAATVKKTKLYQADIRIPDLKIKDRTANVISSRTKYLQSINAAGLKQAATSMGLDIKFGVDAKSWLDKNPAIKAQLDKITALAAEMKKSQALTAQATTTSAETDVNATPSLGDEPSETS